jgi:hypothetical protein
MVRLLTTVLMPGTCAASAEARERAASLLTVPLSVAIWSLTVDWMGSALRAPSLAMRLWRAALRLASSVGVEDGELLQPTMPSARARTVVARMVREVGRLLMAYMGPLFLGRTVTLWNTVNDRTAIDARRNSAVSCCGKRLFVSPLYDAGRERR